MTEAKTSFRAYKNWVGKLLRQLSEAIHSYCSKNTWETNKNLQSVMGQEREALVSSAV